MSWTVLRATLHQRRVSILTFSLTLIIYSWIMMWFYPALGAEYAKMIDSFPPEMLQMFAGTEISFSSMGGFFQIEYLGLMWILIVGGALIAFASRSFAGEIDSGTMEFTLAQPLSRVRLAVTRVAALALYAVTLAASTFVPIQIFGPKYDVDVSAKAFWTLMLLGCVFALAIGGMALLASALMPDAGKAAGIVSGVLVLFWIADMLSSYSKIAEFFDPVNLIGHWQPGLIINGEALDPSSWWLYGLVAVVSLAASVVAFSRRDVA